MLSVPLSNGATLLMIRPPPPLSAIVPSLATVKPPPTLAVAPVMLRVELAMVKAPFAVLLKTTRETVESPEMVPKLVELMFVAVECARQPEIAADNQEIVSRTVAIEKQAVALGGAPANVRVALLPLALSPIKFMAPNVTLLLNVSSVLAAWLLGPPGKI